MPRIRVPRHVSRASSLTTSTTPRVRVPRHVVRLITRLVVWLVVDYFASLRLVVDYFACAACPGASARCAARHAACHRLLHLRRASSCFGTSRGLSRDSLSTTSPHAGSSSTTLPTPHVRVPRHVARLITRLVEPLVVDYFASRRLVIEYFTYAALQGASARHAARRRLLHLRHAFGCLGTSRGSSRGSSRRSSSTTSPPPRVRVPRHVARLVTRLVIDYFASRRLVVNYFAYAACPGASAHRAARQAARRRLLDLCCASGCFGTSRGLSRDSSSTTLPCAGSSSTNSPTPRVLVPRHVARLITRLVAPLVVDYFASRRLVVDYFAYTARPGTSVRRAAHHATRCAARRRLLRLRRASGCLGTSRGSSRRSSSTTSPPLRIRVPRHVARVVTRLVVDYSVRRDFLLRPHRLYFNHAMRRDYLSRGNTGSTSSTPRAATMSSSGRITSTIHLD
jgi:hypothetical protein